MTQRDTRDAVRHWTRLSSQYVFKSRWFSVRQDGVALPSGQQITFTMIENPGFAMTVPLLDDGRVVLERVYRYNLQDYSLECPAGALDGDDPETGARRELREETGYVARSLQRLGSFNGSTGISDERFHLFLATGLEQTGETLRDPTEQIELVLVPLDEAVELAVSGEVRDCASVLALILAHRELASGASKM